MDVLHKVLVTRPLEFVQGLCQGILALGAVPELFPTIHIMPTQHKDSLREAIKALQPLDRLIFVSRSSVHYVLPLIQSIWKEIPPFIWCAVGPGTVEALASFQLSSIVAPYAPPYESESLLALAALQQNIIEGQRVIIFKGNDGRTLLKEALIARGALVQCVEAYQRSLPKVDMEEKWIQWQKASIDMIVCTSTEGMNNLLSLVQRIKVNMFAVEWLKTIPIIVISTRMVEAASILGFQTIVLALSAEDAAIIQAIKEIREGNS